MAKLGVNVDHVATVRQARRISYPSPLEMALLSQKAGCDSITVHLREDRRHIQEEDLYLLKKELEVPLNIELAFEQDVIDIVLDVNPYQVTFVPEKREELTTEGGLSLEHGELLQENIKRFTDKGILVSLFIDPNIEIIDKVCELGVSCVEVHTGKYAELTESFLIQKELKHLKEVIAYAHSLGLDVNAGHGLNYHNIKPLALIEDIKEFNIGHSIISRALAIGISGAVKEMLEHLSV